MKAKLDYKKRKSIIIGLITTIIAIIAISGSVAFIKGNRNASAKMNENNITENTITSSTENNGNQDDTINNNVESAISNENTNDNTENQSGATEIENSSNTTNLVQNNGSRQQNNTQSTTNSSRTNDSNSPSREYTQTTIIPNGGEERLVSEEEKIGWRPITVSAKTAVAEIDLVELNIESHKLSYINNDSINDEPIHSTVQKNDIITYVIQVINHGEVEAKGVNIYDSIPEGTELVEGSISDNGTITNGRISWKMDVPANNEKEPVKVSFKVKVLLKGAEGNEIALIENQAVVNGKPTEETHNPSVTAVKKVNVVANNETLLDNKTVVPGTRLRYTVILTNSTEYDGVTKVTDKIPEGTSIIDDSISEGGKLENGIITWETVKIPANSENEVYFDVTVNNSARETVKNIAKIGNNDKPPVPDKPTNPEEPENPDEPTYPDNPTDPEDPTYTNEVRTPIFTASKTSQLDGQKVRETSTVEYVIKIHNNANPEIEEENVVGTARLNDRYWISDEGKMTFAEGTMVITDKDGKEVSTKEVDEEFLKNIEVTLNAGETATITYSATVNPIDKEIPDEGLVVDEISNNLYWAKSEKPEEPARPENPNDETVPGNPNNPNDPTKPTPDPDDENKEEPIDTVIIEVEEKYIEIESSKIWVDADNEYGTRPESVTFRLFRGYDLNSQDEDMNELVTLSQENSWKAKFSKLKESDAEGRKYVYTVKEDIVKNYTATYSEDKLTVTNKYTNPMVTPEKKVEVVKLTENGEITTLDLAPNAIVEPGTRLRYTITLTNETEVDGYVNVEDTVPAGTTLYKEQNISAPGKYEERNKTITWEKIKVPAATENEEDKVKVGRAEVYFDVTVNKNQKETISNFATVKIPTIPEEPVNPENPQEPGEQEKPEDTVITTQEVKTPVFIASKKSVSDYNSQTETPKLHEENEVTYVVTITNSANPSDEKQNDLTGTAKLEDKFWNEDLNKMTYKSGILEIKNAKGRTISTTEKEENYLSNIEVTLKAGESATLTYVYTIKAMDKDIPDEGIVVDEISNNLYWAKSTTPGEPERPENPEDPSNYNNLDPNDPTPAMLDPDDENKEMPIDTVIVHVEEEYMKVEASKKWVDGENKFQTRPESVTVRLFRGYDLENQTEDMNQSATLNNANNWKTEFKKLRKTDANGREYVYTVKEDAVKNYETSYNTDKLEVENTFRNPDITPTKKVQVVTVSKDGTVTAKDLAPNAIVEPGTRLRYTIVLTNNAKVDGFVNVEDEIPNGTTVFDTGDGKYSGGKLTWNKVKVPAATDTAAGTAEVYFDVTINKDRKETVTNYATVTIPTIPTNPDEPVKDVTKTTNTVKTPVFIASKKSESDYNSTVKTPKLHETNNVTYVVTVTNTANPSDSEEKDLTGTAKLEDKFWNEDQNKMTFKSGTVVKTNADGSQVSKEDINESYLADMNITLKAGQTAIITYIYEIKAMANPTKETSATDSKVKVEWDEISNNLYWAEPVEGEPSRPDNTQDPSNYKNTDPNDPTPAMPDPENENKPGLIDTVIVHVEEEYIDIEATKGWDDFDNKYKKQPKEVEFTLYRDNTSVKTLKPSSSNNWTVKFTHLKRIDANGRAYTYTIKEANVKDYRAPETSYSIDSNNKVLITNILGPIFEAKKYSSKDTNTIKEKEDIDYTITVWNKGKTDGTTAILDSFRDKDANKVTFKSGTIKYYNDELDKIPATTATINDSFLKNKIPLTIKAGGKVVIEYVYTAKPISDTKAADSDGIIRDKVTNDLFWAKVKDTDPDNPDYPTNKPINTVEVKLEKIITEILATKIWEDAANASKRPGSIVFVLQKNGVATNTKKTLTVANKVDNDTSKWQVKFDKLPKYDANGKEIEYSIKEEENSNYVARYSYSEKDGYTVRNILKEDLTAVLTTTNDVQSTVPMDIVFVVDISSSMLKTGDSSTTPRIKNTVDALNTAIHEALKIPNTRIAVQLFNSYVSAMKDKTAKKHAPNGVTVTGDYKLIDLSKVTQRKDGKYINYNSKTQTISTNINQKTCPVESSTWGEKMYIGGTYTQAGIQKGETILTEANGKQVTGQTYNRIPVMILITDGLPTLVSPSTAGTTTVKQPAERPNVKEDTWYDPVGDKTYTLDFARESAVTWKHFYYTMEQITQSKARITTAYNTGSSEPRTCKFYTIGIDMQKSSLVDVLLNPTENNIKSLANAEKNPGIGEFKKQADKDEYYNNQRTTLKNKLGTKYANYTDMSYNGTNNLSNLSSKLTEMITNSKETTTYPTVGANRRINLTGINNNKPFKLVISGKDFDDNTISINKSFEKFTEALSDTTVKPYIKGSYYVDLNNLKSGTVSVTYGK